MYGGSDIDPGSPNPPDVDAISKRIGDLLDQRLQRLRRQSSRDGAACPSKLSGN